VVAWRANEDSGGYATPVLPMPTSSGVHAVGVLLPDGRVVNVFEDPVTCDYASAKDWEHAMSVALSGQ